MYCPECHANIVERDKYCPRCGSNLIESSKSLVPIQNRLPAVLQNISLRQRLAAGAGALVLGMGIELFRRGILPRILTLAAKKRTHSTGLALKDLAFPKTDKTIKLPKGYEMQETVVYMTRVIRRTVHLNDDI
jgi:hypothetical protein